jgi:hypothetical protein
LGDTLELLFVVSAGLQQQLLPDLQKLPKAECVVYYLP